MFYLNPRTPEQQERWDAYLGTLRVLEEESRESDDPWLFHGTSAISAAWIRREGFRPSHLRIQNEDTPARPDEPMFGEGVNWGSVNVATWAAERVMAKDNPPVIIAVRLSDLRRAGTLVPDHFALEHGCCSGGSGRPYDACPVGEGETSVPVDPDWRESLAMSGAVGVLGGARVEGLVFHDPLRDVAVHPNWSEAREMRAASRCPRSRMPPRGMPEATPRTHPPTISPEAWLDWAWSRQWRSPPPKPSEDAPEEAAPAFA